MDKAALLGVIKSRLKDVGLSAAEASSRAVGNEYLIANMGRDRYGMPSFDKLAALADVLGLELYFGPKRDDEPQSEKHHEDDSLFARLPISEASLSAGSGAIGSEKPIAELAFRKDWMKDIGTSPANAILCRVTGDSMAPTIQPNDMVLIDTAKRDVRTKPRSHKDRRPSPIYALRDGSGARIKRIERPQPDMILLISDNPLYPPEVVQGSAIAELGVIGRVMWWGHTNRE